MCLLVDLLSVVCFLDFVFYLRCVVVCMLVVGLLDGRCGSWVVVCCIWFVVCRVLSLVLVGRCSFVFVRRLLSVVSCVFCWCVVYRSPRIYIYVCVFLVRCVLFVVCRLLLVECCVLVI